MIGPRPIRTVLLALALLGLGAATGFAHPLLEREPAPAGMMRPGSAMAPRGPLETRAVKTYLPAKAGEPSGVGTSVFQSLLRFYRKVISPVDGDRCVMAPTCSLYSHQALETHGVLLGSRSPPSGCCTRVTRSPTRPASSSTGKPFMLTPWREIPIGFGNG